MSGDDEYLDYDDPRWIERLEKSEATSRDEPSIRYLPKKPKISIQEEQKQARDTGLATSLFDKNRQQGQVNPVAMQMMEKMGFFTPDTNSKRQSKVAAPIAINIKTNRGGIGTLDKKDTGDKKSIGNKNNISEYEKWRNDKLSNAHTEKILQKAQRTLMELELQDGKSESFYWSQDPVKTDIDYNRHDQEDSDHDSINSVNTDDEADEVLKEIRTSSNKTIKIGNLDQVRNDVDSISDWESNKIKTSTDTLGNDTTLDAIKVSNSSELSASKDAQNQWNAMDTRAKLNTITDVLRKVYSYCVYCGEQYKGPEEMEKECPGTTEEDH